MPDIFLSYNREDQATAQRFAEGFEAQGLSVWWDATLRSGEAYDEVTEAALRGAKAVVVLWSPRSVVSRWVRAEATIAHRARTLVPVTIEPCDRPVMFELTQTADLSHWRGAKNDKAWRTFLTHVRRMVDEDAERATEAPSDASRGPAGENRRFWRSGRNRIVAAAAAALLIVGAGIAYMFMQPAEQAARSGPVAVKTARVSLAVLPFVNLSSDKEQEYFSDGMTEEITSALAKVSGLNVIGRTSAFQFKGANKDLRAIGRALGANHLIEGMVRKAGDKVRITAQLIKADDGTHLWAESYNRELKDVFAVQEEIATAIAGALRVPLGLEKGQSLVASRTADTVSYQDYLRARALVRGRGPLEPGGPLTQAAKLLEQAVARDPDYAPAWAVLAQAYAFTPLLTAAFINGSTDESRRIVSNSLQKAETAAQQAIRLDPNNVDAYTGLGLVRKIRGKFAEAEDFFKQALSLDPGNPEAQHLYSHMLARVGRTKEALPLRRRLQAQEPLGPQFDRATAQILWENGRNDEAIATIKAMPPTFSVVSDLAQVYASTGRYNDAAEALRGIPAGTVPARTIEEAVRLLRAAPAPVQAASLPTMLSKGVLGWVYLYVGAPDRALDFFQGQVDAGVMANNRLLTPPYAPVRKTERFKTIVRKAGLVDYWRARGWPEFCHPTTGDDFVCR